ncbi:helix-turn-helix transcriptional regulator [Streptomyces sp. LX-29]|uniref:helix-turn-helix domain-containing protein n=1 Tax=Streptomyces sp. LX-29 TaxID=2900152 RepID=UPI00240D7074|nr:helix-turn-helix domain-containing protein [Streptomyces sp. LX-29]WFB06874.1 helix-turn-helix transcriptional regulator [Streptomyces sp. LX-29]
MLSAIGLDEAQESAYRALVALGSAEVADLAGRLTLPEEEAVRALRRLERQGLAARSPARPGRWVAAPPGVALGALLSRQRHELARAERAAALLDKEYRAELAGTGGPEVLEVVSGTGPVAQRFRQLRLTAATEVCSLVSGRAPGPLPPVTEGVAHRAVIERDGLGDAMAPGGLDRAGAAHRLRVTDRVPTDLMIADRSLALIPLTDRASGPVALVVHASGLLDALTALFEAVWREAVPLPTLTGVAADPDAAHPDATDLRILSLLLMGLTDASTAKQLDLGLRTVQRRVKRLMELVGVATRLQLGWHAYERGWISRPGEAPRERPDTG